tara:strand:- start:143 stop:352 length:210 start_codon:yes stop_codon:yes gene_type:complete
MDSPEDSPRRRLPFLRRVFLSKKELAYILELLQSVATADDPSWKVMLYSKIGNHLQKARRYKSKKRDDV